MSTDEVAAAVRDRLGPLYEELVAVMIDLGVSPLYLSSDRWDRLVDVRTRAFDALHVWSADDPAGFKAVASKVPTELQSDDDATSLLEAATQTDFFVIADSTFRPPTAEDRAFASAPGLLERLDADGLVFLDGLNAQPHGLLHGDRSFHYHQLLRRSFMSNVNYELVGTLTGIAASSSVRVRVALDERRMRYRAEHDAILERDHWYGPPLDDAILDDLHSLLGETVHGDPREGRSSHHPYVATFFHWTRGTGREDFYKTVEIEELVAVAQDEDGLVLARYLHAIRDTQRRVFIHCDGAVKAYERASYPRFVKDFRERERPAHYRKVFRLDGEIRTEQWSNVVAQWFRGNLLVKEYLSGLQVQQ